jgi:hypothetical protein
MCNRTLLVFAVLWGVFGTFVLPDVPATTILLWWVAALGTLVFGGVAAFLALAFLWWAISDTFKWVVGR